MQPAGRTAVEGRGRCIGEDGGHDGVAEPDSGPVCSAVDAAIDPLLVRRGIDRRPGTHGQMLDLGGGKTVIHRLPARSLIQGPEDAGVRSRDIEISGCGIDDEVLDSRREDACPPGQPCGSAVHRPVNRRSGRVLRNGRPNGLRGRRIDGEGFHGLRREIRHFGPRVPSIGAAQTGASATAIVRRAGEDGGAVDNRRNRRHSFGDQDGLPRESRVPRALDAVGRHGEDRRRIAAVERESLNRPHDGTRTTSGIRENHRPVGAPVGRLVDAGPVAGVDRLRIVRDDRNREGPVRTAPARDIDVGEGSEALPAVGGTVRQGTRRAQENEEGCTRERPCCAYWMPL